MSPSRKKTRARSQPEPETPEVSKPSAFHAGDGWWFKRTESGGVRIEYHRHPGRLEDSIGTSIELDADTWASVVANVCARGADGESFVEAKILHSKAGPS